jgi:hypothetical protein
VAAGQDTEPPNKYALIIGNGAYRNLARLNNPVNDAVDMTAALRSLGFAVDTLTNAGRVQMEEAVERFKNKLSVSRNSYGFLFYAGHGVQSGSINYLIPVDADIRSEAYLGDRAVSVQAILDEINLAGNELNIVVLDACRDNPFSWGRSGSRGLQVVSNQPANSIIVYATSAGASAADGEGRNGLFTSQLLKNLKNPDLDVHEIFRRTGGDVARVSNGHQRPALYNQFYGIAYLGSRPAAEMPQPAPALVTPTAPPRRPEPGVDVYIAGVEETAAGKRIACYWKNGEKTVLTGGKTIASARSIAVFGTDVYVAGIESNAAGNSAAACYWRNNTQIVLSSPSAYNIANVKGIAVSGSDVYVAGFERNDAHKSLACYWKNGVKTALTDGKTESTVRSIAVSGSNVYVTGEEENSIGNTVACYWKNGAKTTLSDGKNDAIADGIALVAR